MKTSRASSRASWLVAAFVLGSILAVTGQAAASRRACVLGVCVAQKTACVGGFTARLLVAKSTCAGLDGSARRACKKAATKGFKHDKAACLSALASCRGCCAGADTSGCSAAVCGDGVTAGSETCDPPNSGVCDAHCQLVGAVTTTTLTPVSTSTTTTTPGSNTGTPGAGLDAEILATTISPAGAVTVTFKLTDTAGVPISPVSAATTDPNQARVRFMLARLEANDTTQEGFTTTFTRYENYLLSSGLPTYDRNGTFAVLDPAAGTFTYTFGATLTLPAGYATLTHTIGGQVQRTYAGASLVANPILDFVPAGGTPATVRQLTTTAQCNACHGTLAVHGGGRREVRLCQLCHTDQNTDPGSGNSLEFNVMIHRFHRGKDLPSIASGSVGAKYAIGSGAQETIYGKKLQVCASGTMQNVECATNADCPGATTGRACNGTATTGVGFPQDIRNCTKCHAGIAAAAHYKESPSSKACASCHDNMNPGEDTLNGLAPGTNHVAGAQPDVLCRVCHTPEGDEFNVSVAGAHTVPTRSAQLNGLEGTILSASGAPGGAVTITFKITDGAGTPLPTLSGKICNGGPTPLAACTTDANCCPSGTTSGTTCAANCAAMNSVRFMMNGPTTDFAVGFSAIPNVRAVGSGASGTLTGPDGSGVYTYVTTVPNGLPGGASGTWRVGMEARRPRTLVNQVNDTTPPVGLQASALTVNEAIQNPVFDFAVGGAPLTPRRQVVDIGNCQHCHGTFGVDFSVHGGTRNQTEYCVLCHAPNVTDFASRGAAVGTNGAAPTDEPIHFKRFIHRLHTGVDQTTQPYLVYGSPSNFSEIRYPRDRRDCAACHKAGTQLLPLPAGVLPTRQSVVDTTSSGCSTGTPCEVTTGTIPPVQAACLACHDSDSTAAHAATMTTGSGAEACDVCHAEGRIEAVSDVHALP